MSKPDGFAFAIIDVISTQGNQNFSICSNKLKELAIYMVFEYTHCYLSSLIASTYSGDNA
jgi:hypothetical protein